MGVEETDGDLRGSEESSQKKVKFSQDQENKQGVEKSIQKEEALPSLEGIKRVEQVNSSGAIPKAPPKKGKKNEAKLFLGLVMLEEEDLFGGSRCPNYVGPGGLVPKIISSMRTSAPEFILAWHLGEITSSPHLIVAVFLSAGEKGKSASRVGKFLKFSDYQQGQLKGSLKHIKNVQLAMSCLLRNGPEWVYASGTPWKQRIDQYVKGEESPALEKSCDSLLKNSACKIPALTPAQVKKKNYILAQEIVSKRDTTTMDWPDIEASITCKEHEQLMLELGVGWSGWVKSVFIQKKNDQRREQLGPVLAKWIKHYSIQLKADGRVSQCPERAKKWLLDLFQKNKMDPINLFLCFIIISDKKLIKIRTLFIHGPSNSFKTGLMKLMLEKTGYTRMPVNNKSAFFLQSIVKEEHIFWEEPQITKANANLMKSLLESASIPVAVKNKNDAKLCPKSFYITSNTTLSGFKLESADVLALKERCLRFHFRTRIQGEGSFKRGRFKACPVTLDGKMLAHFFADLVQCDLEFDDIFQKHGSRLPKPLQQAIWKAQPTTTNTTREEEEEDKDKEAKDLKVEGQEKEEEEDDNEDVEEEADKEGEEEAEDMDSDEDEEEKETG